MWEYLQRAITGPGKLRFIVQPLIAILLGIRDGLNDAEKGVPPFGSRFFFHAVKDIRRRELAKQGVKRIALPLLIGVVFDAIILFILTNSIRPLSSLFIGFMLVGFPYILSREVSNRIRHAIDKRQKKNKTGHQG